VDWLSQGSSRLKPLGIKRPEDPIKTLGIQFTYDMNLLYSTNFKCKMEEMKKLVNIWSGQGLSIYGKVMVIKSLLFSKFVYISAVLPTP